MIAVDTGYFYALADVRDAHHEAALAWQHSMREGWMTTWPVMTEAVNLLARRIGTVCAIDLMQEIADGSILVWDIPPNALRAIPSLMKRYANLPMDLADASLVLLAGHLGHGRILTTDERAFGAYRWKSRKPFQNLMATAPLTP